MKCNNVLNVSEKKKQQTDAANLSCLSGTWARRKQLV